MRLGCMGARRRFSTAMKRGGPPASCYAVERMNASHFPFSEAVFNTPELRSKGHGDCTETIHGFK